MGGGRFFPPPAAAAREEEEEETFQVAQRNIFIFNTRSRTSNLKKSKWIDK